MKTMKLHELFELAKQGKKFKAKSNHAGFKNTLNEIDVLERTYSRYEIMANWEVEIEREPRVIYVHEFASDQPGVPICLSGRNKLASYLYTNERDAYNHLAKGSNTKVVTFIEVMEEGDK